MPIAFSCNACRQSLQINESLVGQTIACPNCGNQQIVAVGNSFDFSSTQNPYQSPAPIDQPQADIGLSSGQMIPTQFDVGQVFKLSFELWKQNIGLLLGISAISFGISIGQNAVDVLLSAIAANSRDPSVRTVMPLAQLMLSIIMFVVQMWISIGQVRVCLNLLRGTPAKVGQMFSGADVLLPVVGVLILFGAGFMLGILLLILPGLFFAIVFWPTYYFVVDKKTGVLRSFSESIQFTKINIANSVLVLLIGSGVNLLGFLACCIGLVASAPLVVLFTTASYLAMTGQLNYSVNDRFADTQN